MTDLTEAMMNIPTLAADAVGATVEADLRRGRSALRRRTIRRRATVALCATAVVGGAFSLASPLSATRFGPTAIQAPSTVQLVRYTQQQPAGFTIDRVPSGWHVLSSTPSAMILGSASDDGADLDGPAVSFDDRIAVNLIGSESLPDPAKDRVVSVGGVRVEVSEPDENSVVTATVPEGNGRWLSIVLPAQAHLTADQAAEFAAGLHSTHAADVSHG